MTLYRYGLTGLLALMLLLGNAPLWAQTDSPLRRAPGDADDEGQTADSPTEATGTAADAPSQPTADEEADDDATTPDSPQQTPPAADEPQGDATEDGEPGPLSEPDAGTDDAPPAEEAAQPETGTQADASPEPEPEAETQPDPDSAPASAPGESGRAQSRVRLELLGAASIPGSLESKGVGFGVGGFVGYDLWDRYGFELLLCQLWGSIPWENGESLKSRHLVVKPGLRYRLLDWKDNTIRFYVAAHAGLVQLTWRRPGEDIDSYRESFGFDGGAGAEFRFGDIVLLDLFAMYEAALNARPLPTGGHATRHGLFIGLALGISSTLN